VKEMENIEGLEFIDVRFVGHTWFLPLMTFQVVVGVRCCSAYSKWSF
jgi:hypothetical protein